MNIAPAIFSILSSDSNLTSALGGTKIFPMRAAQNTGYPYIIFHQVSGIPSDTKDGVSVLDTIRVQFDVYHNDYQEAHTISERVRTLIDKYRGTIAGIGIDSIQYLTPNETFEDTDDVYRISEDYNFRISRVGTIPGGNNNLPTGNNNTTTTTTPSYVKFFENLTVNTSSITLSHPPTFGDLDRTMELFRDGRLLKAGHDFTLTGSIITLSIPIQANEIFIIKYS